MLLLLLLVVVVMVLLLLLVVVMAVTDCSGVAVSGCLVVKNCGYLVGFVVQVGIRACMVV